LARWLRGKPTRVRPYLPWTARLRRSLRRHPVVSSTIVLAVLAAAITPVVAYYRSHARNLNATELALWKGQPVTLIGDTGQPPQFCWRTTEGQPTVREGPDGCFSIQSDKLGLLELLHDPQQQRYRFSAEVRQESALKGFGDIGIYFAGS